MAKKSGILLIVLLFLLCSGCASSEQPNNTDMSFFERVAIAYAKVTEELFGRPKHESEQWMEHTIHALMTDDSDALKTLFSDSVIANVNDIDAQIQDLFEFIEGEIQTYDVVLGPTSQSNHGGMYKESDIGCDITTTSGSYRIAIRICMIDENNNMNEGVQSLYAIKADDISSDVGYWGGIVWNNGVTIEKSTD